MAFQSFGTALICMVFAGVPVALADAPSAKSWHDPGWRRLTNRETVTVAPDGSTRTVVDFAIRATSDAGAQAMAQQTFPYNSYLDTLTLEEFETVKADGHVVPVDPRTIRDQVRAVDVSAPYYDDARVTTVAFSDVAVGDTVQGRWIVTSKRPLIEGGFSNVWSEPVNEPAGSMDISLDVPAAMPVQVTVLGAVDQETRTADRIVHHVVFKQDAPAIPPDGLDGFDGGRRFEASTFVDYRQFAAWEKARSLGTADPDAAITRQAAIVVGDATTARLKTQRLYDWVARNIRYVGLGSETDGLVSQPAPAVLAARYGDCKAHATLLKAMLAAEGIVADLVDVNAASHYTLTRLATPNFDHAIVFVPELGLYLDPTASFVPFGSLPRSLFGKPALDVDRGTIATIPAAEPDDVAIVARTDYELHPDGTRHAHSVLSGTGYGDLLTRRMASVLERPEGTGAAKALLAHAGLKGTGSYLAGDVREIASPFAIDATFDIDTALDLKSPVLIRGENPLGRKSEVS